MTRRLAVLRRLVLVLAAAACSPFLAGRATVAGGCGCRGMLSDEFDAADAGLIREWIVQVPFDSSTWKLAEVAAGDGLVLARSEDGAVHAIRADGAAGSAVGTIAWSRPLDAAAGRAWAPTLGRDFVLVTGNRVIRALDRETGSVVWERPTGAETAAAAVQSGDCVYVPLINHRVLWLSMKPYETGSTAPAPSIPDVERRPPVTTPVSREPVEQLSIDSGGRLVVSPAALGDGVLWATDEGFVALERTSRGWIRHELPGSSGESPGRRMPFELTGQPVIRGNAVFFSTAAGSLARIDFKAADRPGLRTTWMESLPDLPTAGPLVSDDVVVVGLGPSGIAAYAAADGRSLWRIDLVGTPVGVVGGRVWIIDEMNRLTAIDLATGSWRHSYCLGCFTLPVPNDRSERLLLASPRGVVVSLAAPAAPAALPAPVTGDARPTAPVVEDPDATPP